MQCDRSTATQASCCWVFSCIPGCMLGGTSCVISLSGAVLMQCSTAATAACCPAQWSACIQLMAGHMCCQWVVQCSLCAPEVPAELIWQALTAILMLLMPAQARQPVPAHGAAFRDTLQHVGAFVSQQMQPEGRLAGMCYPAGSQIAAWPDPSSVLYVDTAGRCPGAANSKLARCRRRQPCLPLPLLQLPAACRHISTRC